MIKEIAKEISKINLCLKFQIDDTTIVSWAKYIDEKVADFDINKLSSIIDMFVFGELTWNPTSGVQNIIIPLVRVRRLPCLDSHYEQLPNGNFFYKDYEYKQHEWDSFINMKWHDYNRFNKWSKDAKFIRMMLTIEDYINDINRIESDDKFLNEEKFNELVKLLK